MIRAHQTPCPPSAAGSVPRKTSANPNASGALRAKPVGIGRLERFVADYAMDHGAQETDLHSGTNGA